LGNISTFTGYIAPTKKYVGSNFVWKAFRLLLLCRKFWS